MDDGIPPTLYFGVLVVACQFGLPMFPVAVKIHQLMAKGVNAVMGELAALGIERTLGPYLAEVGEAIEAAVNAVEEAKKSAMDAVTGRDAQPGL